LKCWLYKIAAIRATIAFPQKIGARATSRAKKQTAEKFSVQFKNQKHDIFRNIEAWKKNIVTEKSDQSEDEQVTTEKKKDLPKFVPSMDTLKKEFG